MPVLCNTLPSLARPVRVPGFHSMKGLGVILLPPGLDSSPLQYSSLLLPPPPFCLVFHQGWKFTGTHLYSWVGRGIAKFKHFPKNTTQWPGQVSNPVPQPRIHFANNQTIGSLPVFRVNYKYNSYLSVSGITDFSAVKVRAQNCLWLFYNR